MSSVLLFEGEWRETIAWIGAGGNIGADLVAKSPADGYTLLMGAVRDGACAGLDRVSACADVPGQVG